MTDPKTFPIQDGRPIPWSLIAPHEAQAVKNHGGQTLQRLAERGGLSPCEALCAIRGEGIGMLLREPHGLRRDKQTGETICRCTCMHELDDIVRKHRRESSAPSELERLRDALRLAETTRNAAQEVATRETERRREVEERLAQIDAELDSLKNFYVHLASWLEARAEADAMRELAWRWCWVARDGWELWLPNLGRTGHRRRSQRRLWRGTRKIRIEAEKSGEGHRAHDAGPARHRGASESARTRHRPAVLAALACNVRILRRVVGTLVRCPKVPRRSARAQDVLPIHRADSWRASGP